MTAHDVPVDLVATPARVPRARRAFPRPRRVRWSELGQAQLGAMPALAALRAGGRARE
jgi:hypothetical protein